MRLLRRLLYKNIGLVCCAFVCLVLGCAVTLLWNTYISKIVNCISTKHPVKGELLLLSFLCIALNIAITYISGIVSGWVCETMGHKLRMGFAKHLINQSYEESQEHSVGSQMSILQNEITEVCGYITYNLNSFFSTAITFVVTLVYLLQKSPSLTIITNAPTVLILIYVNLVSRIIHGLTEKQQNEKKRMNGVIETLTNMLAMIHIYDASNFFCSRYEESVTVWKDTAATEEKIKARLMSLSGVLNCIPLLILLFFGGRMVIHGNITLGVMYIFINLNNNVSGALRNMPSIIASFRRFTTNLNRIEDVIEL